MERLDRDNFPKGVIIKALGLKCEVNPEKVFHVEFSHPDAYEWSREGYADIEFEDTKGNYRHYKSVFDKGMVYFPNENLTFDFHTAGEHEIKPVIKGRAV